MIAIKANKNDLKCSKPFYEVNIEEGTGNFDKMVKLEAKGGETQNLFSLRDSSGLFSIHPKEGILHISHSEFLTKDNYGGSFNITGVVNSGTKSTTCDIIVKLVESKMTKLQFEQAEYEFSIRSNETIVGKVNLVGGPKNVELVLAKGGEGRFEVDSDGWLIYNGRPVNDSEDHVIEMLAFDKEADSNIAICAIHITLQSVGSNPIKILTPENFVINLEEDPTHYPKLLSVIKAEDNDPNADLYFVLHSVMALDLEGQTVPVPKALEKLRIMNKGKSTELSLLKDLHKSPYTSVFATVKGSDLAHPDEPNAFVTAQINLLRSKKFIPPITTNISFIEATEVLILPKDLSSGNEIYKIPVIGGSDNIKFELDERSAEDFKIGKNGSVIFIGESAPLSPLMLHVTATDEITGAKIFTDLKVRPAEEEVPQFELPEYEANITSDAREGTFVISLTVSNSSNKDSQMLSLQGDHSELFEIDRNGRVNVSGSLENLVNVKIGLLAAIEDGEHSPSFAPVTINVQPPESPLRFHRIKYTANVPDNVEDDTYILQVLNFSNLEYEIVAKNDEDSELLKIDQSGDVRIYKKLNAKAGPHKFIVNAKSENNKTAMVPLDILISPAISCQPNIQAMMLTNLSVNENTLIDTEIGVLSLENLDGRCNVTYGIFDPSSENVTTALNGLKIDEKSGKIYVDEELDHEKRSNIPVIFAINSGGTLEKFDSEIKINDLDDNPVKFEHGNLDIEVPSDTELGSIVLALKAADKDISQRVFYHLRESNDHPFFIDRETGELRLKKSIVNEEENKKITIKIGASNDEKPLGNTYPAECLINVIITERNGHVPVFLRDAYEAVIDKDTVVGSEITRVKAVAQNDGMEPTTVHYFLGDTIFEYRGMSRPSDGLFTIDKSTGKIKLAKNLGYFAGGMFRVVVRASNNPEEMKRGSKSIVRVYVHENSDVVRMHLPIRPTEVSDSTIEPILEPPPRSPQLTHISSPVAVYGTIPALRDKHDYHEYRGRSNDNNDVANYGIQEARITVGAGDEKPTVNTLNR
ncbi:hypothetical protein WR25_04519 [Diploscapter pachys]|uniref:Cadherin domain-containing protein n=1 Tax=Diploscapter pachys TaxID=2018661 RepID=A0A2A2LFS7_9BILA|nr:hypothetical protein WR25_04519 [Diploscapter pachys]